MNIKTKVLHVWSHGLIIATLLRRLSRLGIKIVPYYLFEESKNFLSTDIKPLLDEPFETILLGQSDVELLKGLENLSETPADFSRLWNAGCSCIGLKSEGAILAYGWFDLKRCNYEYLSFELKNNEAYSFNFRTARHMRGRNIAPFLRTILYTYLESMGRNRIYSISEKSNTSAMKFKEKINAKPLRYYVYVNLFNRVSRNIMIKILKDRMI